MILVTVGTNEQPFDRLVRAAAELPGSESLVVQYGSSSLPHGRGNWVDFLAYETLTELIKEAREVIGHAGVGSIALARKFGKTPIVVPRRAHLKEAVDDHQLPLARRLAATGMVILVEDEDDLPGVLASGSRESCALTPRDQPLPGAAALARDVRSHLEGLRAA